MNIANIPPLRQFLSVKLPVKILILAVLIGLGVFGFVKIKGGNTARVQYQTETAKKGTLINSISATGTITSGNKTNITTKASGTVTTVYVTNGDKVEKGQKIAEVELDDYAKERQASAWVDYLTATESVKDAKKSRLTADIQMWSDRQKLLDAETLYKDMVAGAWNQTTKKEFTYNEKAIVTKQFEEAKLAFELSEAKFKNSGADIANASANVTKTLRDYQENSATIVAPSAGTITDLALAKGILVAASTSTSTSTGSTIVSAQTVGKVSNPTGQLIASVSVSEIDVTQIKANQKVTLTLDAFEDKTFTGKVLAVNTTGSVSSGVTAYPVTIILDQTEIEIYPNMAVTAEIITKIESDVLLVPSTAVDSTNNQSTVKVMKDGKVTTTNVETGSSNDSQTVILSGISEGDEVITATIDSSSATTTTGTSIFSGLGGSRSGTTTRSSGAVFVGGGPGGF